MSANGRRNIDDLLVSALACGATYREAARVAHVSERTVRRRLEDEEFRGRVADERAHLVRQAVRQASASLAEAVSVVVELMRDAKTENVRLAAARSLLSFGVQAPDSPTSALGRHVGISRRDFEEVVDRMVKMSLRILPEELHDRFATELQAWARADST